MPIEHDPFRKPQGDHELLRRLSDAIAAAGIPGASLAISHRGAGRCAAAGLANAEAGIEADSNTIFQIGSITKVFTATLAMMLGERGLLDIDRPVSHYLPELRIAGQAAPENLTTRMLLDYTSGVAGEYFEDFGCGAEALERYVAACSDVQFVFEPGSMRGYSSTGYCIAGRVIEVVTGQTFNEVLAQQLLMPLGLERYAFFDHDVARFRTAVGHTLAPNGEFEVVEALRLPHCMSASGASLTTTATDLLRFAELHLKGGLARDGQRLLAADACAEMINAEKKLPPDESPVLMGWASIDLGGDVMIAASGQTVGQNAFTGFIPSADLAISILTNVSGGAQQLLTTIGAELISEAAGLQFPAQKQAALKKAQLTVADRYAGHYTNHTHAFVAPSETGLSLTLSAKETTSDKVVSQTLSLIAIGGDTFAAGSLETPTAIFRFLFEGSDRASHFTYAGSIFARCDEAGQTGIFP